MAQDLRNMLKQDSEAAQEKLPAGHQKRFQKRLEQALPQAKTSSTHLYLKIAAVLVIALGVGTFFFYQGDIATNGPGLAEVEAESSTPGKSVPESTGEVNLRDVSPEFKKIEEYYLANLHLGLSKLNINKENKALIDAFMGQLSELDKEYSRLNDEFSKNGANEETVEALIQNLQLRLELLFKLKTKLDELNTKENEKYRNTQA